MTDPGSPARRERSLVAAFVRLADTLTPDFDTTTLLDGLCTDCVDLLGVNGVGMLLADRRGHLQVASASGDAVRTVEAFQAENREGPCPDSFGSGSQVHTSDLTAEARWPGFVGMARECGFGAVHTLPMSVRDEPVGALDLFHRRPFTMSPAELLVGQALADVATIAVLTARRDLARGRLVEQLQGALSSRVIIEQAKGVLAERAQIATEEAFVRLRGHARSTNSRLAEVAGDVVSGRLDTAPLGGPSRPADPRSNGSAGRHPRG